MAGPEKRNLLVFGADPEIAPAASRRPRSRRRARRATRQGLNPKHRAPLPHFHMPTGAAWRGRAAKRTRLRDRQDAGKVAAPPRRYIGGGAPKRNAPKRGHDGRRGPRSPDPDALPENKANTPICRSLDLIHRSMSDFAIHRTASIIGKTGSIRSRMPLGVRITPVSRRACDVLRGVR